MTTLTIEKPLYLNIGLRAALVNRFIRWADRLGDWYQRSHQRELEAYLGKSQNSADLERRLRERHYAQGQTLI